MFRERRALLLGLLVCGLSGSTVRADPEEVPPGSRQKPEIRAVRVESGPEVDGRLDDPVWQKAPAGEIRHQYLPRQKVPVTERTTFRLLYDRTNLYLGVWCYDSEPDRIVARLMEREGPLWLDDNIIFVLDTFHDLRNGYVFFVNPNGARRDGLISGNVNENHNWDGIWSARTSRDQNGWQVEVAIPFETLSFDPALTTWGFNLDRTVQRKPESGRWAGADPRFRTGNVSEAGLLTGLHGLQQGLGLEVRPYLLGRGRNHRGGPPTSTELEWGGDLQYRLTPQLSATLSYNTDFAETEVDLRQINFTRFPLFFPEKRHFFLENSGVFEFGGLRSGELIPYFSRRIGLSETGRPIPIDLAAKVSGRAGPYEVGVVGALLDDGEHALATRLTRSVFEQSTAGLLVTSGDPDPDDDPHLVGADFRYRTTDFLGDRVLEANFFGLGSFASNSTPASSGAAYGFNLAYPNDVWVAELRYHEIGRDFNPGLGFVPRTGVRAYQSLFSYGPRPASLQSIRQLRFTYENEFVTDLGNRLESSHHRLTPLSLDFAGADRLSFSIDFLQDKPSEAFLLGGRALVPADDYEWIDYVVRWDLAPRRLVSGFLEAAAGDFYHGKRHRFSTGLDILPSRHLSLRVNYDYNRIDLPADEFDTHLAAVRMGWHFTPDLFWSHLVQYDRLSEAIGYHGRVRWDFRPGSTVFVVFTQAFLRDGDDWDSRDTEATVKLGMTFRF